LLRHGQKRARDDDGAPIPGVGVGCGYVDVGFRSGGGGGGGGDKFVNSDFQGKRLAK
jgi:hypothetical protein